MELSSNGTLSTTATTAQNGKNSPTSAISFLQNAFILRKRIAPILASVRLNGTLDYFGKYSHPKTSDLK